MTWHDNLRAAIAAFDGAEKGNWEVARLTALSTLDAGNVAAQTDRVPMAVWCAAFADGTGKRFSPGTGQRYKRLWRRWSGHAGTERPAFADAVEEDVGKSVSDVHSESSIRYVTTEAPAETRREVFSQLAADPVVIEDAAAFGSPTSQAVTRLEQNADSIRERRHEQMIESDPVARRLDRMRGSLGVDEVCIRFSRECERFATELREAFLRAGAADDQQRVFIREMVPMVRSLADALERYAENGQTDLDDFLSTVLRGGSRDEAS